MNALRTESNDIYWTLRRIVAFVLMQVSVFAYALGAGAFIACKIQTEFLGGPSREITVGHVIPLFAVLYAIGGFMILAVISSVIALIFSRSALYLAILYVPTSVYAYYLLSA